MRQLLDIPHQHDLDQKRTIIELHPEPELVRIYQGGASITSWMPLTAARGLVRVLRARHGRRVSYSIRKSASGGRGGNTIIVE